MAGARGPLPNPKRRRRNAPTIPTTQLPVSGRQGPAPAVPSWIKLEKSGRAWWAWAWSTPQAVAWGDSVGQEPIVARRAQLEDDLDALEQIKGLDLDWLDQEDYESAKALRIVKNVARLAIGRLQVLAAMKDLDNQLGLTPQAMARLRWTIVADPVEDADVPVSTPAASDELAEKRRRILDA